MAEQKIECPECHKKFALTKALTSQFEEQAREDAKKEFAEQLKEKDAEMKGKIAEAKEEAQQELEEIKAKAKKEKEVIEKKAKKEAEEKNKTDMADLRAALDEKEEQIAKQRQSELALRKKERELNERVQNLALENAKKLEAETVKIREEASRRAAEESQLKLADKDRKLAEMTRQIDELRRKAEQGSQQSQGETLELELEDELGKRFPSDSIEPVAKGKRGADVLQVVYANSGKITGKILWETKRTKSWGGDWIDKLKEDTRAANADVAILVSQVLPEGIQGFGFVEGVLVCELKLAIPIAIMVRSQMMQVNQVKGTMENRGGKMEILYDYMTGNKFKQRLTAIVETFDTMKEELDREKKVFQKQWAAREGQIIKLTENTVGIYGDLQGLGADIQKIESLEVEALPASE